MNSPRNQFLSCAGLTRDKDRKITAGRYVNMLQQGLNRRRFADDTVIEERELRSHKLCYLQTYNLGEKNRLAVAISIKDGASGQKSQFEEKYSRRSCLPGIRSPIDKFFLLRLKFWAETSVYRQCSPKIRTKWAAYPSLREGIIFKS